MLLESASPEGLNRFCLPVVRGDDDILRIRSRGAGAAVTPIVLLVVFLVGWIWLALTSNSHDPVLHGFFVTVCVLSLAATIRRLMTVDEIEVDRRRDEYRWTKRFLLKTVRESGRIAELRIAVCEGFTPGGTRRTMRTVAVMWIERLGGHVCMPLAMNKDPKVVEEYVDGLAEELRRTVVAGDRVVFSMSF